MSRRAATVTQADVARIIRAAKQAGASEVVVNVGEKASIVVRINPSTNGKMPLEDDAEIVL